ncbi:chaperone protein dnaJ C76, chloroplastic [Phragmites australis]|uniref:chaperone protein dnaJ C76, chloroplastic n=1 Tax=Phragmites australis TaxID=29695 RepID=UPI002D7A1211|nr:chaperone protein dnaJ C76, chloroplastic [Phragmites australis]
MPALLLNTVSVSPANPRLPFTTTRRASSRHRCRADASGSNTNGGNEGYRPGSVRGSWVSDYDLYELLGVEPSSPQSEIKAAYRTLQKRCHPDVAGAAEGHDMAIVLNEVYALLSDPASRLAYDQEQARRSEFAGYTGRPLYSSWLGGEAERRAVFVDEVRCVGCLKCALHASRTFAIESVYGRARVVAQWADGEDKILDAIQTCPVDCISMVERSDLAALEFLMSKQPRGRVRVSEGNAAGARAPDIFAEVNKFQKRFQEMKQKSATRESQESETVRQSRTSAVHAVRSMSNWWYWRPFGAPALAPAVTVLASRLLPPPPTTSRTADPVTDRLQEAAAARRKAEGATAATAVHTRRDDYWTPQLNLPSSASPPSIHQRGIAAPQGLNGRRRARGIAIAGAGRESISIDLTAPLLLGIISAGIVGYNGEEMTGGGSIQEHVGGAVALGVVNSFELKVMLAGLTWFIIGAAIAGLIQVLGRKEENIWK